MGGELLVEALILRPIHDHKDRRKQHENDGADGAGDPRQGLQQARAFAGGVEEDWLAKHGVRTVRVSAIRSSPPATRIYALRSFVFQRQNAASLAARAPD